MSDVFISYVDADGSLAIEIAMGLQTMGYSTWYYGDINNNIPGIPYLQQTRQAIENCRAVVLILSENSLSKSNQVNLEVVRALECNKPFLPVLSGITWSEFKKRQPDWDQAMGGVVGISVPSQGARAILPRLAAGLKQRGIQPGEGGTGSQVTLTYLLPLAATYAQKMARPADPQQSFQVHTNLADMAEAVIKTLTAIVVAQYRQASLTPGKEDQVVEDDIKSLAKPALERWVSLLHTTLGLFMDAPHPLIGEISTFLDEKHLKDPAAKAAVSLSEWLKLPDPRKPPVSFQVVFELLAQYRNQPEGWGANGALYSSQEYQQRAEVLFQALDLAVAGLSFLSQYRLVCIKKAASQPSVYQIYDASGRELASKTEELHSPRPLEAGHVYLCQTDPSGWQAFLDLFPLLVIQECRTCKQVSPFFLSQGRDNRQEYNSPACGHRLELGEAFQPTPDYVLANYLSLESWRSQSAPVSAGSSAPYLTALREVMHNGVIDNQKRGNLDFLAKMLRLPAEVTARLEAQVVEETKPPPPPPPVREAAPPEVVQPSKPVEEQRLVLCWQKSVSRPPRRLAFFASPALLFCAEDTGAVQVLNQAQETVYEDRLDGRPYQVAVIEDRLLVSTWKGQLYCFNAQELVWQAALGSPLSALAVSSADVAVVAGGWDGQIAAFDRSGRSLWKTRLDDGISCLAISPNGDKIAAGTYAGQLCLLGADAAKTWLQDMRSPIFKIAFTRHSPDLIVARRDRTLLRIHSENQSLLWDFSLEKLPLDFTLTSNDRRLVLANQEGSLTVYNINGGLNLRSQYAIAGLSQAVVSPISADGNFIYGLSDESGLVFIDNRSKSVSTEVKQPAACLAISADGRCLAIGGKDALALYRLGRPQVEISLEPLGRLSKGRFTRLRITLHNKGELLARNIEVSLEGPLDCKPTGLPVELKAGESIASDKQSLQPLADGALPVYLHLKYSDDFGIHHEQTDRQVLESSES